MTNKEKEVWTIKNQRQEFGKGAALAETLSEWFGVDFETLFNQIEE